RDSRGRLPRRVLRPTPEAVPPRWFRAAPTLPTRAASASVHWYHWSNETLPAGASHSASFPISTRDATAESQTYLRPRAFAATRLQKPVPHATSRPDE